MVPINRFSEFFSHEHFISNADDRKDTEKADDNTRHVGDEIGEVVCTDCDRIG